MDEWLYVDVAIVSTEGRRYLTTTTEQVRDRIQDEDECEQLQWETNRPLGTRNIDL